MQPATPSPPPGPARLPAPFVFVLRPLQSFFRLEAASSILLLGCAVAALVWANSPVGGAYRALFSLPLEVGVGGLGGHFTLGQAINDGLMTIFFFVVGMEIKRELVLGELRTLRRALLPLIAAAGGMAVPAAIYLVFNGGTPAAVGWAIPMATDIAFSIGVLTLLRGRVANSLIVFLTALAIFDDMGGILVIALFYGSGLHGVGLLLAALGVVVLVAFNRFGVLSGWAYLGLGVFLWWAVHHAGIHATISGVILGFGIPAVARRPPREVLSGLAAYLSALLAKPPDVALDSAQLLGIEERLEDLEPPLQRFVHALHPLVAFVIVPVFALANSGVDLSGFSLATLLEPLPLGIALGLVVGKALGIFGFTLAAVKARISPMPEQARTLQVLGTGLVGGIGFTVAIFVAQLAFAGDARLLDEAKLGILVGSLVAAVSGYVLLRLAAPSKQAA